MTVDQGAHTSAFQVTPWAYWLGGLVERHKARVIRLADWETRSIEERLEGQPVRAPIYISGLARAGTTILLEILAQHPAVGTHQYRDYPFVLLPYWWNWFVRYAETKAVVPQERAHGDRIVITPSSPEAMEETIWMAFFPELHNPARSSVLDRGTENQAFEAFYRTNIAKLLLVRGAERYVSKANYNISRLAYLQRMFPDARFIVPIREPMSHVASLMRQHRRFTEGLASNPKGREHLRRIGHFEFGPDRQPIQVGPPGSSTEIAMLWAHGEEVRGWARYWATIYGFVADQLEHEPELRAAVQVVRYEDLCRDPAKTLGDLFAHAELDPPAGLIETYKDRLSAPTYYKAALSDQHLETIREETRHTRSRFGYSAE